MLVVVKSIENNKFIREQREYLNNEKSLNDFDLKEIKGKRSSFKVEYNPMDNANFELFTIKNSYPHCIIHGAMNKVSKHEDGGGYWRCISTVSNSSENTCRCGILEKRN